MTDTPLMEVQDLTVRYGRIQALQPISLQVGAGSVTYILGANGAGKTSLMRALAGLASPGQGRILLQGRDVSLTPAFRRVRSGIALVPEGRGRLPGLSVRDNLILGWHAARADRRSAFRQNLHDVIALFPRLGERLENDCSTLSGGEMQMLAIARALLAKPLVLLLDEPSLGLAPIVVTQVYAALAALNARGLAMVIVEQKAMPPITDNASTLVLRNGHCVFNEHRRPTPDELAKLYLGIGATA